MNSVPNTLYELQKWFGGIITQRLYSDIEYAIPAAHYVASTAKLSAEFRMQIYNESYWMRLLAALHEEYAFLSRLFGKTSFDEEIGIDYLTAHPPSHWSLNFLGKELFTWLKGHYNSSDNWLVHKAAEIDWACQQSFFAPMHTPIDLTLFQGEKAYELLDMPLKLAPSVHLIEAAGDFMPFRQKLLQQSHDYWVDNDFPKLAKDKPYYFCIFRNSDLNVSWDPLEEKEFELLRLIQAGHTIDQALDKVDVDEEAALWVQKWLIREWLVHASR